MPGSGKGCNPLACLRPTPLLNRSGNLEARLKAGEPISSSLMDLTDG